MSNISYTYANIPVPVTKARVAGNSPWVPLEINPKTSEYYGDYFMINHEGSSDNFCLTKRNLKSFIEALQTVAAKGDFK